MSMTTTAVDPLVQLAERLTDGRTLDLGELGARIDPALLARLQEIEALASGFGALCGSGLCPDAVPGPGLTAGSRFGNLIISALLGRGAYGEVYQAHDPTLDREVALKIPSNPSLSRRDLLREGQLMARIDHPNALRVFGAIEDAGRIGFACELMQGETLEQWWQRQGTLGAHELIAIGSELSGAIAALHRGNVLHGDLKPSNVLRHPDGRWVVADFGSSQFAHDAYGSSGTPLYMAPERFRHAAASPATDQYSLGVLLFRLATHEYPFEAETTEELQARHERNERRLLIDLRPDLPRALIQAIERALSVEPARRFASIGGFAQALADAARAPVQRKRERTLALVALVLAGVAAVSGAWRRVDAEVDSSVWLRTHNGAEQVLRRGDAVRAGESLALEVTLPGTRHVYVVNEDSNGERFQLFPVAGSELANPVPAGRTRLPGSANGQPIDWHITSRGGQERFYVLISEQALPEFGALALTEASAAAASTALYAGAPGPVRGVGGLTPSPSRTPADADAPWLAALAERHPDLRIERFELSNP